jgi:type VI secretion system protein VasD
MTTPMIRFATALTFIATCASAGCGKAPPAGPPLTIAAGADARGKAAMTIAAAADANPDASGRPSPVVVRVYQLKTDAAFRRSEFFALFDDEQKALGEELISRDEFVVAPAERRTLDVAVSGEARYVGAVAAFRDIRNSQWRVVVPAAPRKALTVAVERTRVLLTVAQ